MLNTAKLDDWYEKLCKDCDGVGSQEETIEKAASLSYRASVLRALSEDGVRVGFKGKINEKNASRAAGEDYIKEFLRNALALSDEEELFSLIHTAWDDIRDIYHRNEISWYTYGNAQKWIAMAMKYYFVIAFKHGLVTDRHLFVKCTFPVDSVMTNHVYSDFGIVGVTPSWSQGDSKSQFVNYVQAVKTAVESRGDKLLAYEIGKWQN